MVLVTAFTLHHVNIRFPVTGDLDESFQTTVGRIVVLNLLFFGSFYTLWRIWKDRAEVVGELDPAPEA